MMALTIGLLTLLTDIEFHINIVIQTGRYDSIDHWFVDLAHRHDNNVYLLVLACLEIKSNTNISYRL